MSQPTIKPMPHKVSKTSGKAVTSLILGLASFFCMFLTGIPAIIFGILGLGDIKKGRGAVGGNGLAIAGIVTGVMGCFWTCLSAGLLLPAVQQVREAARETVALNNMRQMTLGKLNYESAFQRLPTAVPDPVEPGRRGSLLSWRVQILPFLEANNLYDQFNHQEPWDSPHNLALVDQMPEIYKSLSHDLPEGKTIFVSPVSMLGPNGEQPNHPAIYVEGRKASSRSIGDGPANTILILEVDPDAAVTWTKPDEWEFDPDNPMRDVGNARISSILVAMADGAVRRISNSTSPEEFKAMVTANSGDGQASNSATRNATSN